MSPAPRKPCPRFKEVARAARGSPAMARNRAPLPKSTPTRPGCPGNIPAKLTGIRGASNQKRVAGAVVSAIVDYL
jgi:hypothetical protein